MTKQKIKNLLKTAIKKAQKEKKLLDFKIPKIPIEHPSKRIHGDYTTNIAMTLAKKTPQDPFDIARIIMKYLKPKVKKEELISKVKIAQPGFINFFLSKSFLLKELNQILTQADQYGKGQKEGRVIIDYSSPNIAKSFGIGHLRSTIIGQALYNIYEFLGWECIGENHLGDWGTQFGKLLYQIKEKKLEGKSQKQISKILKDLSIEDLEKMYVEFHRQAQQDPSLKQEARKWFKKLKQGDPVARKVWKICRKKSLKKFQRIYDLLGVDIDYIRGESFYQAQSSEVVQELQDKELTKKSKGAWIVEFPEYNLPPAMVLKSDGAPTYFTRDLAAVKHRLEERDPDLIIYEVGTEQSLHFRQLFRTVELLGWASREKFFHVAHGLIRFKKGKISTRKGESIPLEKVLKEAISRARKIIEKSKTGADFSPEGKEKLSRKVGIGAVKYNDLSQHYSKDIVFDWQKILNLKGNSGPYLQYTFARCQSVLKKAEGKIDSPVKYRRFNTKEKDILRTIYRFKEVVQKAGSKFSPNLLCNFAFDLAQKYNLFYNSCPIIKAGNSSQKLFRLSLTKAVAQILKSSLSLLGISAPSRM